MAILIPPITSNDHESERILFDLLANDKNDTKDWIVLHSLDSKTHPTQTKGEADFVVIMPGAGVLVLEVKGAHRVKRDAAGLWYYGDSQEGEARGPFKQAESAMYAVRGQVLRLNPDLEQVPFESAVAFTGLRFDQAKVRSDEWNAWQVIDQQSLARPIGQVLLNVLENSCGQFFKRRGPSDKEVQRIKISLRGQFEFLESPASRILRLSRELRQATVEQQALLDSAEENDRLLVVGPAGTGKTVMAIELARRAAYRGKKILLVCFNRFLANLLQSEMTPLRGKVTTDTIDGFLAYCSGPRPAERGTLEQVRERAVERILNWTDTERFDYLIVDEAQDISCRSYLDILDLMLRGGLAGGNWAMLGDFSNQLVFQREDMVPLSELRQRFSCAQLKLGMNCRNTPRVGRSAEGLCPSPFNYTKYRRPDDGVTPRVVGYDSREQQEHKLVDELSRLYSEGFSGRDIVVLSALSSSDNQCAKGISVEPWKSRLKEYSAMENRNYTFWTTIRKFKGLEAPIVILTDFESLSESESKERIYVGITRSTSRVTIMASKECAPMILSSMGNLA